MNKYFILIFLLTIIGCAPKKVEISQELVPFKPDVVGKIKGLVFETDAKTPIPGVIVVAYDKYGYATGYAQTDIHGRYTIHNLPFGQYFLQIRSGEFYGTAQKYAGEYYKNAYIWEEAGIISIDASQPEVSINFLLEKGGAFRGKIINKETKKPIANTPFFLMAYKAKNHYITYFSHTDSLGTYLITGLEPGSYKIKIEPEGWVGGFLGPSSEDWESAKTVESMLDTVILPTLETNRGGTICGKVTPFAQGIMIQVIGKKKALKKNIDSTGYYIISGLPEDKYIVKLSPKKGSLYLAQEYSTKIEITSQDTVSQIDFQLIEGGVISGTVKDENGVPIEDFDLTLYSTQSLVPIMEGKEIHSQGGNYKLCGVPEGEYILKINSFSPRTRKCYVRKYYDSMLLESAIPIKVKKGFNTSGINFTLKRGGWIEGFIVLNTQALSSEDIKFKILAFNVKSGEVFTSQNTFCGGYRITGLPYGEYKLCAFAPNSKFANIWFGGGRSFNDPKTQIVKIEKEEPINVNFSVIFKELSISGKIYDALTKTPISGKVIAYDITGHIAQLADATHEGYVLQGLIPQKYYLRTYKVDNHYDQWYKDYNMEDSLYTVPWRVKIPPQAQFVEIKEESVTGIDFELKLNK